MYVAMILISYYYCLTNNTMNTVEWEIYYGVNTTPKKNICDVIDNLDNRASKYEVSS